MNKKEFRQTLNELIDSVDSLRRSEGVSPHSALYAYLISASQSLNFAKHHLTEFDSND